VTGDRRGPPGSSSR